MTLPIFRISTLTVFEPQNFLKPNDNSHWVKRRLVAPLGEGVTCRLKPLATVFRWFIGLPSSALLCLGNEWCLKALQLFWNWTSLSSLPSSFSIPHSGLSLLVLVLLFLVGYWFVLALSICCLAHSCRSFDFGPTFVPFPRFSYNTFSQSIGWAVRFPLKPLFYLADIFLLLIETVFPIVKP